MEMTVSGGNNFFMTFSHILDQIEMFYFTILSESVTNTSIYSNEKFLIFSMQDCFNCKKIKHKCDDVCN